MAWHRPDVRRCRHGGRRGDSWARASAMGASGRDGAGVGHLIATSTLIFGRYLLPIVPLICLIVAQPVFAVGRGLARRLKRPRLEPVMLAALCVAVLGYPALRSFAWARDEGRPTTRDVAYEMLTKLVPEPAGVAVERSVLWLSPRQYRATYVTFLIEQSTDEYLEAGISYAVASSHAFGAALAGEDADAARAYMRLFKEWRFRPRRCAQGLKCASTNCSRNDPPALRRCPILRCEERASVADGVTVY